MRDNNNVGRPGALAALVLLLLAPAARGGEFDKIASQLSRAAKAHGRRRAAVLPFQVIGGKSSSSGRIVSERLLGPLTADGSIEVVERSLQDNAMREVEPQLSEAADARTVKELGKILNVDVLIVGTVIALKDDRVEINARLIDIETARILFASEAKVAQDWNESLFDDESWRGMALPSLPNFDMAAAASATDWSCENAEQTEDDLERSAIDLKARYWAQKLRGGGSPSNFKKNPGAEIRNPNIRAEFYKRLRAQHATIGPDLDEKELARLKDALERIARMGNSCHRGTWTVFNG